MTADEKGLVLVALGYAAITSLTVWSIARCLRTGVLPLRGPWFSIIKVSRDEKPITFWVGLSPAFLVLALEIFIGLFFGYQLWSGP
jgi:uncharacterized membrane protein HdeD (DUF308 family)